MTRFLILSLGLALAAAGQSFDVLQGSLDSAPASAMMGRYFHEIATSCLERRNARYNELKTAEDIMAYQEEMRAFFVERLGGFPERTALNARVVERGEREHFRFEKVIFESMPHFFVTGILYLPKSDGPFPGVIVPCGHSNNGKASEAYQQACMLLAANGMAAFCYDPVGQGERYAYLKEDGAPEFGTTLEHTLMGVGAILTGMNTASYRVWDGMRAIDYLTSRDDIFPDRIGCTGNSGGGTLTSYLMALDERIQCAAPSCYLTTFERLLATIGPQDAEQNIFGQIAQGMDHADYIHMRAPKPTLICSATQDFFDIGGTWTAFREAKRLFGRMGRAECIDLIENDDKHGFSQPLREGAARWMSRWLLLQDRVIEEPDFEIFSDAEAQCTERGQVMLMEGAVSVLDLTKAREIRLQEKRAAYRASVDDDAFRHQVRRLIALEDAPPPPPEHVSLGTTTHDGRVFEQLLLKPEPGIVLPAVLALPENFTGAYVIAIHDQGKQAVFSDNGAGERLLAEGHAVMALDLRGLGETFNGDGGKGWEDQIGADWQDYFFAYLLGKTYVGMRTADLYAAAGYLRGRKGDRVPPLYLTAYGQATVPALHAAALAPGLFEKVLLVDGIPSWSAVATTPRAKHQLMNCVHDALSWYDLDSLAALLPSGVLEIQNAHVPLF